MLLLLGLLAVGQCGAGLMGGPKCTWGPTYWCANLQQVSSHGQAQVYLGSHLLLCYLQQVGSVGTDGWAQVHLGSHLLVC
jgi:hypothetical protein